MNHVILAGTALLASVLAVLCSSPAMAGLNDVKVTTDTSIDCSSIQSIARDLYKECKTDEEKAIATWYFVRRVHFHWPEIPTWDSIDLINSFGFALCGYQSKMFSEICNAGGLKSRNLSLPGHVIAEAFYNDSWHLFDCQVGWYVLKKDKSAVASCEDIKKDPSIVLDAVADGRGSKPFFQCNDKSGAGVDYATQARPGGQPAPPKNKLVMNLPRGTSITRTWANEGKSWYNAKRPEADKWMQPQHTCTGTQIDVNDPVNWPFWKTYSKAGERANGVKRYYGNGRLEYEPDLGSDAYTDAVAADQGGEAKAATAAAAGAQSGGVVRKAAGGKGAKLQPAGPGKECSIVFKIESGYVLVDAWLDATGLRGGEDVLSISAKPIGQGEWKQVYAAEKTGELKIEQASLKEAAWFGHGLLVKLTLKAGKDAADVGIDGLKITGVFMNNFYSLPYFKPGKNKVSVAAADGADVARNKLTLEYVWQEEGAEKDSKQTWAIDSLPHEKTVEVGGKELPRMKSLKLSVAP